MSGENTQLANAQAQGGGLSTMKNWLQSDAFKDAVAKALPKHMTPERFLRVALTATMRTPKLLQCTQESMFNCLLTLSQYGLEPDGRRAHLIPFENKKAKTTECTLIIDYKGLAELVMRSGMVSNIHADVVCENDDFEYDRGFITRHKIDYRQPRGDAFAAYCIIRFKDGTEKVEVMSKDEILAIRNKSQGWYAFTQGWAKQSPWNPEDPSSEREMWKKTAFKRVSKWVPLSPEIYQSIEKEDQISDSITMTVSQPTVIDSTASKSDALVDAMLARQSSQQEAEGESTQEQERDQDSRTTDEPDYQQLANAFLKDVAAAKTFQVLGEISEIAYKSLPKEHGDAVVAACNKRHTEIEAAKKSSK